MEFLNPARTLPLYRRALALFSVNVFVFAGNMFAAAPATTFGSLAKDFGVPFSQLADLITYPALLLGLANLFWVPTALCIGKRWAIIFSMIIALAGVIWSCVAPTYDQLLASRIVASFGSVESIGPSIIADLVSPRYYATAMAFYALSLSGGSQLGPLVAGYVSAARGWRWFFITCVIVIAVDLVVVFFLLPETLYEAHHPSSGAGMAPTDEDTTKGTTLRVENASGLESSVGQATHDAQRFQSDFLQLSISERAKQTGIWRYWLRTFIQPISLAGKPAILYSSITYGIVLGSVIAVSTLSPQLFSPPPYHFSEVSLGLLSSASFIGILLTFPVAGPLTDKLAHFLDTRNGEHKPRHRLPALIAPFFICPAGIICFGCSVARHHHYALPALGSAMLSTGLTLVPSVTMSYVAEVYAESNSQAFVAINALKNVIGFGFAKGSYQWMERMGVENMFFTMAGIEWAALGLGLFLYFPHVLPCRRT
ncbi:major facilitator superfamily domain-containing protein [Aspergillus karnatakaensis]|uniref:major facilitator superfamily domain-containing protein n=1 Tax=Aspergillus karnatakaensis TaxID=1810916 RepID=UPI003CCE5179